MYVGNGSPAEGWPLEDAWIPSFDTLFQLNAGTLLISCAQFNAPDNSQEEIQGIYNGVVQVSQETGVDPRFIFAIMMQESTGCVRAPTTNGGVMNPGLMQDHNGTASCNTAGVLTTPCPQDTITQMIRDGTAGTPYGDGLEQLIAQTGIDTVQKYYMAARMYNSGSIAAGGDLGAGVSTHCYSSDIANRLTGWVHAAHACCLNEGCYGGATTYASTPVTGWWSTPTTAAIIPSWLATTNGTGTATEPSTYIVTIQPSVVSSVLSAVLTDTTSNSYPSQAWGGEYTATTDLDTAAISTPTATGGIFAPVSETFSIASSLMRSAASTGGSVALSTSNGSFTVPLLVTPTPTSSVAGDAATYVLTLGTQTVTYTVQPNDIYWATVLSPYVYWAATSTPGVATATTTSELSPTPVVTTPTTTISYEAASAAGLTPTASVPSLVARFAASQVLDKRPRYDVHFTTMLVDVPVNVPVPFETRTAKWKETVTVTQTLDQCIALPTAHSSAAEPWSGPWAPQYTPNPTGPLPEWPMTSASASQSAWTTVPSSHAYPSWTSSWTTAIANTTSYAPTASVPSSGTWSWRPTWTGMGHPTGYPSGGWNKTTSYPTSYPTGTSGTGYPTGWSSGRPSGYLNATST